MIPKLTIPGLFVLVPFLIFVGILGTIAFSWGNSYSICFGTPFPSLESVEKGVFFELPDSANDIEYDANGKSRKNGCTAWVKFGMDSQEIESFKASTLIENFEENLLDEAAFLHYSQEKGWHQSEGTLAGYRAIQINDTYVSQWIFWEDHEANNYTVYIITNKEWL